MNFIKTLLKGIFYLFFPLILGTIIGFVVPTNIYVDLIKPPFSPPAVLFPIVWAIIYLLMGLSYFIIRTKDDDLKTIFIYYLQLFFNITWSIIFFVLKWKFTSFVWIIILDLLVINMINLFKKKSKLAGLLNILYLTWIIFASYLTGGIYILN